jgi:aldehyde:ferredoxin oxidoreductase
MLPHDPLARVLTIDLAHRSFQIDERPELFEQGLGGTGVAIRLLQETCPQGADPLGPDNPAIFAVGPLVGLFPLASKTVAMFKSPHTGELGESHAGGRSAVSIRMAGYGAIVIRGRSDRPVYLVIEDGDVHFRDAAALWGMKTSYTVGTVLREREGGEGHRSILRIGPAGEKRVTFASVIADTYRHFGRLGLGAVFGAKNLKAIVIQGKRTLPVANQKVYKKLYDDLYHAAVDSELMKKYHELGTPMNVLPLNELGAFPTRNLKQARFDEAEAISGETFAQTLLGRRVACTHCPVACIHLAALRLPHPKEPYFYKTSMIGYDYEPIFAVGSLLGISSTVGALQLMEEVENQGLDVMSTGVALAWTTEALERGLISQDDTDGLELEFGEPSSYLEAIPRLTTQPTPFYEALAHGVDHAASVYGGEDFALAYGANESPGYHTGPAAPLGFLTSARHSHLDSAGYSLDEQAARNGKTMTEEEIVDGLLAEERWRQVLSSLVVCFFARKLYTPEAVAEALSMAGVEKTPAQLQTLGREILAAKHAYRTREGFDMASLRIPKRLLETETPLGRLDEAFLRRALSLFAQRAAAGSDDA